MEEKNITPNQEVPTTSAQPSATITQKSSPWPWIIGGCLTLVMIIMASIFLAGWWGVKKVKEEVKKYEPTVENMKDNIDKMSQEAEKWEKESQKLQENLPDLEP